MEKEEMMKIAASEKKHEELLAAMAATRMSATMRHKANMQILADMAAGKITPADALVWMSANRYQVEAVVHMSRMCAAA
jgi:hypothetical protein